MENSSGDTAVRVLCTKLLITENGSGLQWLIGSPFLSDPPTIISTVRCVHTVGGDVYSPDYQKESGDLRTLLIRGLHVNGALTVRDGDAEKIAAGAIDASRKLRRVLFGDDQKGRLQNQDFIAVVVNPETHNVSFFVAKSKINITSVASVIYEKNPEKYFWDCGCLLRCQVPIKLPVCLPTQGSSDMESIFSHATEGVIAKFKDPQVAYMVEALSDPSAETPRPVILHGLDLDIQTNTSKGRVSDRSGQSSANLLSCVDFCMKSKHDSSFTSIENADTILVTLMLNSSKNICNSVAPLAEYVPAIGEARLLVVSFKLEVLCYASKDLLLADAIQGLVIPGLVDQLNAMKNATLLKLSMQHPQLHPYHFNPPGFLHPVTALYELNYGETEMNQVEVRRSLHVRLGLPFDRPLLRVSNALSFNKDCMMNSFIRKGPFLLRDVHLGIPSSGVSGGSVSLVQGSYEYYHYMHDGFDDSGWGCAYRSLQTIISWFKLQQYTNIDVPSHREIQQSLVEIGDKDPSFIGSREWIGAIELSFVLDKLLGVSCKVINVRSGAELPEKCRELALHFETQGTPIMIGGGVLAYTLLGIDYNEASGDCAFLILDPHYTGNDDLKKIIGSGWCGWKKAVDSRGKSFFLHDKFYNLLLPQRPNMV